jgi:multidrug efflux pump subunit AcrB
MQTFKHQKNLIGIFAQHKVAANLLMLILLLAGFLALSKLNTQQVGWANVVCIGIHFRWHL